MGEQVAARFKKENKQTVLDRNEASEIRSGESSDWKRLATAKVFQHRYGHRALGDSAVNPISRAVLLIKTGFTSD